MSDRIKGSKVLIARSLVALSLLAFLAAVALSTTGAFAGRLTDISVGPGSTHGSGAGIAPTVPDRERHTQPRAVDAFAFLQPGINGTCSPPANGGSVSVNCT